jgi:hypothetical protein
MSIVALNVVIFSVLVLPPSSWKSPFSAYEALFTAAPLHAASGLGFDCTVDFDSSSPTVGHCAIQPTTGPVRSIAVSVLGTHAYEMTFRFNDSAVTLGDLILLWGKPLIRTCDGSVMLSWNARKIAALASIPDTKRIDYFVPIQFVVFSSDDVPGWERLWLENFMTGGCNHQRIYSAVPGTLALAVSTMRSNGETVS